MKLQQMTLLGPTYSMSAGGCELVAGQPLALALADGSLMTGIVRVRGLSRTNFYERLFYLDVEIGGTCLSIELRPDMDVELPAIKA